MANVYRSWIVHGADSLPLLASAFLLGWEPDCHFGLAIQVFHAGDFDGRVVGEPTVWASATVAGDPPEAH